MSKSDLIDAIKKELCLSSKAEAMDVVKSVFKIIELSLLDGNDVSIPGFGKFKVKVTSERPGRNPKTNEPVIIPAGSRVVFVSSTTLKSKINSKE